MDDSCAVCADALEWVAYGSCGHRDVCSTCVARLRFICEDRRCCICKTESPVVFVTKALGDYTRTINDFTLLPSEPKEGRVAKYWYHEDTQAFFDDVDHYKMVKAMCRLSCSVCDAEPNDGSKRREKFRNIEQLKGHLYRRHKLFMCSLCLEGRKVFICEQKLYTRAQLNQHIRTGDSGVDGSESERGGFMGHPMCEFCKTPFYGDNELYTHMSTEHYTCHICQRQHPGQYEYYKSYDDLEIHFRRDHFQCEDEACLAKKFVVFQTEAEMKRHNTIEHGGRMSRSKRSAALQIPTSFRYRRSEQDQDRRGRGRTFRRDESEDQLSMAIQASLVTAYSEGTSHDPLPSSEEPTVSNHEDVNDIDSLIHPFESLIPTDPEASSRYLQALGHSSRNAPLEESSFPPLAVGSSSRQQRAKNELESLPNNTMAAHLRRQSNRKVTAHNSAHAWPAASHGLAPSTSTQNWPNLNTTAVSSRSSASGSAPQNWLTLNTRAVSSRSSAGGSALPSYASSSQALSQPTVTRGHPSSSSSTGNLSNSSRMSHSASGPNLVKNGSLKPTSSDFPPVSAIQAHKSPTGSHILPKVEDVQSANRSLVEKMRAALDYDEDKYASFKDISAQYRQGSIDTKKYVDYVKQYGLSHLVLELARLCPDPQKQKELVEIYNANLRGNGPKQNGTVLDNISVRDANVSKKVKGIAAETSRSKDRLADSFMSTVRTLQSDFKPEEAEEVEVLSKGGYRADKGKSNIVVDEQQVELRGRNDSASIGVGSHRNGKDVNSGSKQRKKTSKFHRVRLGDGSMAANLDLSNFNSDPEPSPVDERSSDTNDPSVARGVWRKGGVKKLFS